MYKVTTNHEWLSVESDETIYTCRLEDVRECYIACPPDSGTQPLHLEYRLFMVVNEDPATKKAVLLAKSLEEADIRRYYRRTVRAIMTVRKTQAYYLSGNEYA